jgi:hypothetical protein
VDDVDAGAGAAAPFAPWSAAAAAALAASAASSDVTRARSDAGACSRPIDRRTADLRPGSSNSFSSSFICSRSKLYHVYRRIPAVRM